MKRSRRNKRMAGVLRRARHAVAEGPVPGAGIPRRRVRELYGLADRRRTREKNKRGRKRGIMVGVGLAG